MGRRGASILTLANGGCRNLWYDYSLISGTIDRRAGQGGNAWTSDRCAWRSGRVICDSADRKANGENGKLQWNVGMALNTLLAEVRACQACAHALPLGPRPVLQISSTARVLVASQAPGTKVHASGIPFDDASGERLRDWMGVAPETFYDERAIAILPIGFCYPGRKGGGDAPPRRECALLWRSRLMAEMPQLRLTLLVGTYAQSDALGPGRMTDRVHNFRDYLPSAFPLPHPSWRSQLWAQANPWFEADVLPELRKEVRRALIGSGRQ